MRKNIFEIQSKIVDYHMEITRIDDLLTNGRGVNGNPNTSIESLADRKTFMTWPGRMRCISCRDMRTQLHITSTEINHDISPTNDTVLNYLEYAANIVMLCEKAIERYPVSYRKTSYISMAKENIQNVLDSLNYETYFDEQEQRIYVKCKNSASTIAAEAVREDIAHLIIKYNYHSLQGNLMEKQEILHSLANEIEPYNPKTHKSSDTEFYNPKLFDDVFFMLNSMGIRHNNNTVGDKNYKAVVANMAESELELWYDELYQMILLAFLEIDRKEAHKKIDELKKQVKGDSNGQT